MARLSPEESIKANKEKINKKELLIQKLTVKRAKLWQDYQDHYNIHTLDEEPMRNLQRKEGSTYYDKKGNYHEVYWDWCEIRDIDSRVRSITRDIQDIQGVIDRAEKLLGKKQAEVKKNAEIEANLGEAIAVIKEFLENWKTDAFSWYTYRRTKYFEKAAELDAKEKEDLAKYEDPNDWKLRREREHYWYKEERELRKSYRELFVVSASISREKEWLEEIDKLLEAEKERKYKDLINRVNEVTGKIISIDLMRIDEKGNLNGIITGENGRANLHTESAGGYNIQCFHYRTYVTKLSAGGQVVVDNGEGNDDGFDEHQKRYNTVNTPETPVKRGRGRPRKLSEEVDIDKITKTLADEGIKNFPINTTKGTQHYFPSKSGQENIFMRAEDGNYVLDVYAANKPDFRELRSGNEAEILHNCRRAYNDTLNNHDDTLDDKYMSRFAEEEGKNMVELKVGDIVNIKEFRKYDDKAKVTEIGKIRGGYFAGHPFVSAYQSWGDDHAPGSTAGHNFCFMKSVSSGEWVDLDNDTLLDSKYWPYLDNLFGYNKVTEAKNGEEDFQNWSKDKRKRYLDYLQKSVKSIMMGGESRHSADYNKPMTVKKTGSDTAFAYSVHYTNKQGVGMAYEFRGNGLKSDGLYGCFPNSQVQRLYKEFQEKESSRKLKEFIEEEASKRVSEQAGPIKTLIGFIRSGYCELKEPEILEFKQFLADEKEIYEEDYKKFRPLAEWQEYLEDFKEYKEAAEDNDDESLQESKDNNYIAKIGDKLYLQGNSQDGWDTTADAEEAAVFESKTEPTQIVNQMKKDGKISKNTSVSVEKFRESDNSVGYIKGNNMSLYGTSYILDPQRMPMQLKGVMQYAIPTVDATTKKKIENENELLNSIRAGKTIYLYDKHSHVAESKSLKEGYDDYEDIEDNPEIWDEIGEIERGGFDAFDNSDLSDDPKVIQRSIDMEFWKEKLPELSDVELGNLLDKIDSGDVPSQVEDYLEGYGHPEFIDDMLDPAKVTVQNVYDNLKKEAEKEGFVRDEDGYPCQDTSDNRLMEIIKYQMDSFVWEAADCTGVTDFLEVFGPYKEMPKVGEAYNKVLTQAKQFNELAEGLMVKERIKIPE